MTRTLRPGATTLLAIGLLACGLPARAQVQIEAPLGPVLAVSHRGASYVAPEHTRFAYDKAIEFDVDMLECDLQMSKDNVLVCIHDTTVTRTSGGSGRVDAYTVEQLRQRDWGTWFNNANPSRARPEYAGARLVTFEEQLACYLRHNPRMRFHVETKAPAEYGGKMEPALVELLARLNLLSTGNNDIQTSTVVVQSFDLASLREVKRLAPTLPTAFLFSVPPDPLIAAGILPDYVDAAAPTSVFLRANPGYVAAVHRTGKEVHTWTVDNPADMDYLLDIGIDGIFSNRPDILRDRIDAHGLGVDPKQRGNPTSFPALCQFPVDPPPNVAPVSQDVAAATAEDEAVFVELVANDVDSPAVEFSIVAAPQQGVVGAVSAASCEPQDAGSRCTASVLYVPHPDYTGADAFTYKANDGRADSNVALASVSIAAAAPGDKAWGNGQIQVEGGRASFKFSVRQDVAGGGVKGALEYRNHARILDVRSTAISAMTISGPTARVSGTCRKNGAPCTFTAVVDDRPAGQGGDHFSIEVSEEPAEAGAVVTGNVRIKQR